MLPVCMRIYLPIHLQCKLVGWEESKLMPPPTRIADCRLTQNVEPLDVSDQGREMLIAAMQSGSLELVQWLVPQVGLDVQDDHPDGWTLLHYAAQSGSLELVQWLHQQYGTTLDLYASTRDGATLLHFAASAPQGLKLVRWLAQGAADRRGLELTMMFCTMR